MSTPSAGLWTWWLPHGGALLVAACMLSWLLPLPSWARFLWNLLVAAGCFHLIALHQSHRDCGGDGGRDEA
ncbi:hypothetical protein OG784_30060 [Streptomyces sp. NBC_01617]|uniref:hypothetical protein n=1 Tax=Streptomyces sp. NBC_01617 TaxID=2975899 RepID=UPI00386C4443|nr:hypothetical protein OG784_30060 [Streptomyces sp. NBC_01617]